MNPRRPRPVPALFLGALFALLGLGLFEWLPHGHQGPAQERACAVCQVARHDGTQTPPAANEVPRPTAAPVRTASRPAIASPLAAEPAENGSPRSPPLASLS